MKEALFKIGETIILQSINYPELNGEYTVEGIITAEEANIIYYKMFDEDYIGPYCYDIGIYLPEEDIDCRHWEESALRKKYPPSKLSFQELMQECKSNIVYE